MAPHGTTRVRVCLQRVSHGPAVHLMRASVEALREPGFVDYNNAQFFHFELVFDFPGLNDFFDSSLPRPLGVPEVPRGCLRPSFPANFCLPLLVWSNAHKASEGLWITTHTLPRHEHAFKGSSTTLECTPWVPMLRHSRPLDLWTIMHVLPVFVRFFDFLGPDDFFRPGPF